ncbi:MAG TPA: thiolase family protein [Nitrospiria bacterium]|nr:thiolase family protein [Nitrospiria bacterium]HUK55596.1 thiolase family protein [Nitrospiria bacterium]
MKEVVVVDGVRTPIGNFGGTIKDVTNQELGRQVVRGLLQRTRLGPDLIEEVIFGCVLQNSDATNLARVVSLMAGLPIPVPAYTVQRNCSSGLQSVVNAFQNIQCGDADVQIAGGIENMSLAPYIIRQMRWGKRLRHGEVIDSVWEGLTDAFCGQVMGSTAENLAEEFKISREEQDAYALESHRRALIALKESKFTDEIIPVTVVRTGARSRTAPPPFERDEAPDPKLDGARLAQNPAIFKEGGTVTAGNACPLNDGAAALLVMSAEKARALNYEPLGYVRSYAFVGVEPERMGIGPAAAIPKALEKAGAGKSKLSLRDIQLFEINEAFAAQYLAVERVLKLDRGIVNVNGGAIALGHPVGMTGARLILTLLREMKRRDLSLGVASMCVGGGLGAAMVLERK